MRLLLEAAPAGALAAEEYGCFPLHWAANTGSTEAMRLLLEVAPAVALTADAEGSLPLHNAAMGASAEAVRLLLSLAPETVLKADETGRLPLHAAAGSWTTEVVRLLLEVAPAAALTAAANGQFPLHVAAGRGSEEAVSLLLEAAPAAALAADVDGRLPIHTAADWGNAKAVRLLLEVEPAAALTPGGTGRLPLEIALDQAVHRVRFSIPLYLEISRLLLPATPTERALAALDKAGRVALPLFANLAACSALSPAQWQRMPPSCPGLGTALPAVLKRSVAEAALLVARLPVEARQCLRTAALCLGRAQRERHIELPAALVGQVLALAAGA